MQENFFIFNFFLLTQTILLRKRGVMFSTRNNFATLVLGLICYYRGWKPLLQAGVMKEDIENGNCAMNLPAASLWQAGRTTITNIG